MKTSLEVMNLNAPYEVRSKHIVEFQKNAMLAHCNKKIYTEYYT